MADATFDQRAMTTFASVCGYGMYATPMAIIDGYVTLRLTGDADILNLQAMLDPSLVPSDDGDYYGMTNAIKTGRDSGEENDGAVTTGGGGHQQAGHERLAFFRRDCSRADVNALS